MDTCRFDPFVDRQARLLRNRLSRALIDSLKKQDPGPFRRQAGKELARWDMAPYHEYIHGRLASYGQAFAEITRRRLREPFAQALVLWNQALFFEVHALLETVWLPARGDLRAALQAMIRAAGVSIHLEAGHREAARKMAAKAAAGLRAHHTALPPFAGREELLAALEQVDNHAPPRLDPIGP